MFSFFFKCSANFILRYKLESIHNNNSSNNNNIVMLKDIIIILA